MKTLYLLRHAKSSWKDETLLDIERPLNSRGRRASQAIGGLLKKEKIIPDLFLSSSAVRARETADIVMESARLSTDLRFDERIYEASPQRLLEVVKQIEKGKEVVLLVGSQSGVGTVSGTVDRNRREHANRHPIESGSQSLQLGRDGRHRWNSGMIVKPKELQKA